VMKTVEGRVMFSALATPGVKGPWTAPAEVFPMKRSTLEIGVPPVGFTPKASVA